MSDSKLFIIMKRGISISASLLFAAMLCGCCRTQTPATDQKTVKKQNFECIGQYDFDAFAHETYACEEYKFRFSGTTKDDFKKWQTQYRTALKEKLGLDKIAAQLEGYKPRAEKIKSEDLGFAWREHWIIWTEPKMPLPFILFMPKKVEGNYPFVMTLHGHESSQAYAGIYSSPEERAFYEGTQDVAYQAAQKGFISLLPKTRGIGDCARYCKAGAMVGRTLIGDRVWDVERIMDWALENLPIDPQRLAITGNSGGGNLTFWAAALDDRYQVASPHGIVCSLVNRSEVYHCVCNYIHGIFEYSDIPDIVALAAPKKMLVVYGRKDTLFPLEDVRIAYDRVKEIYTVAGAGGNCSFSLGPDAHRYYCAEFFDFMEKNTDWIKN